MAQPLARPCPALPGPGLPRARWIAGRPRALTAGPDLTVGENQSRWRVDGDSIARGIDKGNLQSGRSVQFPAWRNLHPIGAGTVDGESTAIR